MKFSSNKVFSFSNSAEETFSHPFNNTKLPSQILSIN